MLNASLEPLDPYPGALQLWRCRCTKCGYEVFPRFNDIHQGNGGCGYCAGNKVDEGKARQIMLDGGLEPLDPYPGANNQWRCRCTKCGYEVFPRFSNVKHGQGGCAYCAGKRVDEEKACQIMLDGGLEPLDPYPGANNQWRCRCIRCGHEVFPSFSHVQDGHRCIYCAEYGFDFKKPALLYVIRHDEWMVVKIGIQGMDTNRIDQHLRNGWRLMYRWSIRTGIQAREIEQEILSWWREEIGAPPALYREQMPQAGHTETVSLRFVSLREIRTRVETLRSALGGNGNGERKRTRVIV
jgi:hypothetical protein